ncbi:MAG TPA: 3-deoxy-7-phosphoheptulonate synthase [Clostridia bacterium]|nr:3-deoxy-7-phosphoheptulonate synthase [Clostridia bacterium]HPQ47265.1 3-deoxy-7-phosphoheptulonate synthase [Clostridia bacterium]
MIIVLKPHAPEDKLQELIREIEGIGLRVDLSRGAEQTILGLIGDTHSVNEVRFEKNEIVAKVMRVQEPYKKVNRLFKPDGTVVKVAGHEIGGKKLAIIAGPCSVESEEQIISVARDVQRAGAGFLRGGAFKPRTSPYSFQGLGEEGLDMLITAKKETGMPIVSEIMDANVLGKFVENVDIIQVGARNMQNYSLLKELGKLKKPILLKKGFASTIEEWLMAAEYVMSGGNENIILCERGMRTFETFTRNTMDMCAVPVVKRLSHLPVISDPSHGTGISWLVEPAAKASISLGADGLMIEVHNCPDEALCDGNQALTPEQFESLMKKLSPLAELEGRGI